MKIIFSIIITASCLILSQCRLVSDKTDYALYHDYYPALKMHQYNYAEYECKRTGVNLSYIIAIMYTESRCKDTALSRAGAIGSMQIMPFHMPKDPKRLYDPKINIHMGVKIFRDNLIRTRGDYLTALAKYHAGQNYNLSNYRWWHSYVYKIHCNATEAV